MATRRPVAVADVRGAVLSAARRRVYRLWRDLGFAVGAIVAGVLADRAWMPFAMSGKLTAASFRVVLLRMRETNPATH